MNPQPLELRSWFKALVGLLSLAPATICFVTVSLALPEPAFGEHVALSFLFVGAWAGFATLLGLFLPLLVAKLWPNLDVF